MRKKVLLTLFVLIAAVCLFCLSACTDTPPADETPGDETPDGGAPEDETQTRKVLDTLAGKNALTLYTEAENYISRLRNVTIRDVMTYESEEGGVKTTQTQAFTLMIGDRLFAFEMTSAFEEDVIEDSGIWYDGTYVYMQSAEGAIKMKMSYEEFNEAYSEALLESTAFDRFEMFSSAILYEEAGKYYMELFADSRSMTIGEQAMLLPEEDALLEGYTLRLHLDATGKYLSESAEILYSVRGEDGTVSCRMTAEITIEDVGVTVVKGPLHPETFLDIGEGQDPNLPDDPDFPETVHVFYMTGNGSNVPSEEIAWGDVPFLPEDPTKLGYAFDGWYLDATLKVPYDFMTPLYEDTYLYAKWTYTECTVFFRFADPMGNPIADTNGYTERVVQKVLYGTTAYCSLYRDTSAFAGYTIVGWDIDGDGIADDVNGNITVTDSVVFAVSVMEKKPMATVILVDSNGETLRTVTLEKGSRLDAIDYKPVSLGRVFEGWDTVFGNPLSVSDGDIFRARYRTVDGTIGKVAAGTIVLDGKCDDAYLTSGAYLPLNTQRQADREITAAKDVTEGGTRAVVTVRADTYIVWDGSYIYLLMAVSDTTLTGRSDAYLKAGIDSWLNDTVELRYCFEQSFALTQNNTRVGIDAMGYSKYALGRNCGIGGGRSTHYDEIEFRVRNRMLGDTGSDLSLTGYVNDATYDGIDQYLGYSEPARLASYIIEVKLPARTEGSADLSQGADPATGRLPGASVNSNHPSDYAFTDGDALSAGDFVRFSLQINDLTILLEDMTGDVGAQFWDSPSEDEIRKVYPDYSPEAFSMLLFLTDQCGNIVEYAGDYGIINRFSAAGNTQKKLSEYLIFSLGDDEQAQTKIRALGYKNGKNVYYSDKAGTQVYVRN